MRNFLRIQFKLKVYYYYTLHNLRSANRSLVLNYPTWNSGYCLLISILFVWWSQAWRMALFLEQKRATNQRPILAMYFVLQRKVCVTYWWAWSKGQCNYYTNPSGNHTQACFQHSSMLQIPSFSWAMQTSVSFEYGTKNRPNSACFPIKSRKKSFRKDFTSNKHVIVHLDPANHAVEAESGRLCKLKHIHRYGSHLEQPQEFHLMHKDV